MWSVTLIWLTTWLALMGDMEAQTTADVKNVFKYLFTDQSYNPKIRPADDQLEATEVSVDFVLKGITQFDEKSESLITSGFLDVKWIDPELQWRPKTYNNIQHIFIPQDDIWKPDLSLQNTFNSLNGLGSSHLNVFVTSKGLVNWFPYQILTSTCSVDITFFPFDVQICPMKFVAWSYSKYEVNLILGNEGIPLEEYETNSAWDLIKTSAERLEESEESAVVFYMHLKRKSLFYMINIVVPVLMLSILSVFTFVLPLDSGERASYSITVFLSLAVFMTIVSSTLPQNSDTISLLGIYVTMMTLLSTLMAIVTLVELRLFTRDTETYAITTCLLILHRIYRKLSCSRRCSSVKIHHGVEQGDKDNNDEQPYFQPKELDWKTVLDSFDYLAFWFFFLTTAIFTIALFCVAVYGQA